jgi:hypothetical protein
MVDPDEFPIEGTVRQRPAGGEPEETEPLGCKGIESVRQGDHLRRSDCRGFASLASSIELAEDVARGAEEAFDVCPDQPLEFVTSDEAVRAAPIELAALSPSAAAAVPPGALASLGPAVAHPTEPAGENPAQEIGPAGVLRDEPVGGQRRLRRLPDIDVDKRLDLSRDQLAISLLGPPPVPRLAPVQGIRHQVPDPPGPPDPSGSLLPLSSTHLAAIPCVVGWDAERVELRGNPPAAPSVTSEPVVDQADNVGR